MTEHPQRKAWLVAGSAALVGAVAAGVFAVVWFRHTAGDCGVVRFYEQAFGVVVLVAWCLGTGVGASLVLVGWRKGVATGVVGSAIAVLTSLVMVLVCVTTVYRIREADYSLKSTEQLLGLLAGEDLDAAKLAAHTLGERRAPEAVPSLGTILNDNEADTDLRHNAAIALGKIGGPDARTAMERARDACRDDHLRRSIDAGLERIRDTRQ
ncbi:MAG: HEAT repeat domain-containing protein [Sedimentisphaerales bacterium]|nr:HEAT repeat domain-containing protein [Sedimentisphaerales bacterium]